MEVPPGELGVGPQDQMRGILDAADASNGEVKRLTAIVAKLRGALIEIAAYDRGDGCCPYGCDTPSVAAAMTVATRPHQVVEAAKETP